MEVGCRVAAIRRGCTAPVCADSDLSAWATLQSAPCHDRPLRHRYKTKTLSDGWTVVTADASPSAHFEHTVLTTERGPEILTIPRPPRA